MRLIFVGILASVAAFSPLLPHSKNKTEIAIAWPTQFDERSLSPLPLAEADKFFQNGFPGHVARFSDGRRQIVLRQVNEATRKLHPARDCFQALGYTAKRLQMQMEIAILKYRRGIGLRYRENLKDHGLQQRPWKP